MNNLQELLRQKEELERQIHETRTQQRSEALAQIREIMRLHEITVDDLGRRPQAFHSTPTVKYRDPETGATWSGRGRVPGWMKGKDKASYAV